MRKIPCLVEDNMPKCPHCITESKIKISDVDVASIDDETHFEIEVRCNKCKRESYYFLVLEMIERKSVDKKSDRFNRDIEEKEEVIEEVEGEM